jgi:hypothetical protein
MVMGFLVHDYARHVLASFYATKPHIFDPGIAEAIFAWKMIEVVAPLGYHSVLFEGDSLEIVQALKMEGVCLCWFGQVVNEAKLCLSLFHSWNIVHVRRSANNATHCLAEYALSLSMDWLWILECPSCIQEIVAFEQQFA